MRLNTLIAEPEGEAVGPPLVIVHGLFGSARNWSAIARRIAQGHVAGPRRVIAVDLRNHGDSGWDADAGYGALAADLAETIGGEIGAPVDLLGHSMGGKAAMLLALRAPELIARLIVADIAPVTYAGHSHLPYIRAMQAVDLSAVTRRADADAMLLAGVPDRALRGFLLQSLSVAGGPARWKLNLPALAAHMDAILGFPDVPEAAYGGPALFVHGAASDYVAPVHRPAIHALFPKARFVAVKDAGHWLHAEKPEAFLSTLGAFLTR
jgi:pimeloyl-ACP methyl ester carboxylesterase